MILFLGLHLCEYLSLFNFYLELSEFHQILKFVEYIASYSLIDRYHHALERVVFLIDSLSVLEIIELVN